MYVIFTNMNWFVILIEFQCAFIFKNHVFECVVFFLSFHCSVVDVIADQTLHWIPVKTMSILIEGTFQSLDLIWFFKTWKCIFNDLYLAVNAAKSIIIEKDFTLQWVKVWWRNSSFELFLGLVPLQSNLVSFLSWFDLKYEIQHNLVWTCHLVKNIESFIKKYIRKNVFYFDLCISNFWTTQKLFEPMKVCCNIKIMRNNSPRFDSGIFFR